MDLSGIFYDVGPVVGGGAGVVHWVGGEGGQHHDLGLRLDSS